MVELPIVSRAGVVSIVWLKIISENIFGFSHKFIVSMTGLYFFLLLTIVINGKIQIVCSDCFRIDLVSCIPTVWTIILNIVDEIIFIDFQRQSSLNSHWDKKRPKKQGSSERSRSFIEKFENFGSDGQILTGPGSNEFWKYRTDR